MAWSVVYHPEAEVERAKLPALERLAIKNAVDKLTALGPNLPYPHSSSVRGATNLRELRPRGGRSPFRAFYRQVGAVFVIAAVGPEAQHDKRGFNRTVKQAQRRLDE